MLRKLFQGFAVVTATFMGHQWVAANDSKVDIKDNVLVIESDDEDLYHDLVSVGINPDDPNEVRIYILQFANPFNLFDFASEEEAFDAAEDVRIEDRDFDDFNAIEIRTFAGNDCVYVASQIDTICKIVGGDGDDDLTGGSGPDTICGDSDSTNSTDAGEDVIRGMAGNDYLLGGPEADSMYGGLHDDTMFGNDGNDTMFGNSGDDNMYGQDGEDTMRGGPDDDYMHGMGHADDMKGDGGDDTLYGNRGDDIMDGGPDSDVMHGGSEDDDMWGGEGSDQMYGGAGNDQMFGEQGWDFLHGGANDDYLDGSYDGHNDYMHGGGQADTFVNHYYESRTAYFYQPTTYRYPVVSVNRYGFPTVTYETLTVWVLSTYTYTAILEAETVEDYSAAEGDEKVGVLVQ